MSRPTTGGHKKVSNSRGVSVGRNQVFSFFVNEPPPGTPRHVCKKDLAKVRLRRTNARSYLTLKVDNMLKLSTYDATPFFGSFTAQTSKCPSRFWKIAPEICHGCS